MIIDIPGHVLELGVYKSASLIRFATYREALENAYSRKIIGFDSFGDFPKDQLGEEPDLDFVERFESAGGAGLATSEVDEILKEKGFENIDLIEGNIFQTLPSYLGKNPETRIALLHLDMDVKEPTEFALEHLYDRVVPGGLIVADDYNAVAGATGAVDALCRAKGVKLEKLPFYSAPAFVKKPVGSF
jgi:hypothetical protein